MAKAAVQRNSTAVVSQHRPPLSDDARALIAPLPPSAAPAGRPQEWPLRLLREAGCSRHEIPPRNTWKNAFMIQRAGRVRGLRVGQVGLVLVRNARMLRAGHWGPHGDLRDICKLLESQ